MVRSLRPGLSLPCLLVISFHTKTRVEECFRVVCVQTCVDPRLSKANRPKRQTDCSVEIQCVENEESLFWINIIVGAEIVE